MSVSCRLSVQVQGSRVKGGETSSEARPGLLRRVGCRAMDKTKSKGRQLATIRQHALAVLVIVYAIVFCSTFKANQSLRPTTLHGPARELRKQRHGSRVRGTTELASIPNADGKYQWTSGEEVTQILKKKLPFPDALDRLRFLPGGLNMTHAQTLHRCWADPNVYRLHFPLGDRLITAISHDYHLIYMLIPKCSSSTGRSLIKHLFNATQESMSPVGRDLSTRFRNYSVITSIRDPLSRFYSQYDEVFLRYGPWMKKKKGRAWDYVRTFDHPFPYLYDNMTDWPDYQEAFCPAHLIDRSVVNFPKEWCSRQPTRENGTLSERFERFVHDYDGLRPWDLHQHLQVTRLSNRDTGKPRRVSTIYKSEDTLSFWTRKARKLGGGALPDETRKVNARSAPRRFNSSLVSLETKRRICRLSAIDYCCLNLELPPECEGSVTCSLDKNDRGVPRIQPWFHPNEA